VHNTYFTLPVLVAMLSNHYGFLYGARHNWLVLVVLMAAGALIRHSFVARHRARMEARRVPWEYATAGALMLLGVVVWLAPVGQPVAQVPVSFAQVRQIVSERCVLCHGERMVNKNVQLHTPELVRQHAQAIYQQAVVQKTMPLNNATQMTEAERAVLKRWVESGARRE
jgi:uncharacterized membrane protein